MSIVFIIFAVFEIVLAVLMLLFGSKTAKVSSLYHMLLGAILFYGSMVSTALPLQSCNSYNDKVAQQHQFQTSQGQVLKR